MPSINNFLQGFTDGLPGMKDFRHASRLYLDDNFRLAPKNKFLYHVVFDINDVAMAPAMGAALLQNNEKIELNMLVKAIDLPKYNFNIDEKIQYNKKMYTALRIQYEPVNITFHDDHADTVNAFWKKYYEYTIADGVSMNSDMQINATKDDYYKSLSQRIVLPGSEQFFPILNSRYDSFLEYLELQHHNQELQLLHNNCQLIF